MPRGHPLWKFTAVAKAIVILPLFVQLLAAGCRRDEPRLIVALGRLESWRDEGSLSILRYRVDKLERGTVATNLLTVLGCSTTVTGSPPERAILVLSRPSMPGAWYAVGDDFRRGVVPDTPENRTLIVNASNALLLDNPRPRRLPKERAEALILRRCNSESQLGPRPDRIKLTRVEFGWRACLTFANAVGEVAIGSELFVRITDDGEIISWHRGL